MSIVHSPAFGFSESAAARVPAVEYRETLYTVRFARSDEERDEVLRLRFEVFNLELDEGLEASFINQRDEDRFDRTCHHLIVVENATGRIVGTYRVRTLEMAGSAFGFYSAEEFTIESLPCAMLSESMEIGRACIARAHRNSRVLFLLWKGLAAYMREKRKRYVFGCCSLPTLDRAEGRRAFARLLGENRLHESLRVAPRADFVCLESAPPAASGEKTALPPLFETYLRIGAQIGGEPALDRRFKTIDFFVIVDSRRIPDKYFRMFFG